MLHRPHHFPLSALPASLINAPAWPLRVLEFLTPDTYDLIYFLSNPWHIGGAQQMFLNWIRIHMKQYSLVVKHEFGSQIWVCLYHLLVQVWFLIWKMRFKIVLIPWFCLCVCTCILNDYIYKMLGPAHSNHTVNISSTIILHISLILVASKWN